MDLCLVSVVAVFLRNEPQQQQLFQTRASVDWFSRNSYDTHILVQSQNQNYEDDNDHSHYD